jgi:hypothetical protein
MDLDVRPNFVLAIRPEVAQIARVLRQLQMFGFDVEVQMIVAFQNLSAVWTNPQILWI